jgi:hypothetical protein
MLQLGPVVAAIVVIAGLGIVLPLYLSYEADRDRPVEIDVSADEENSDDGVAVDASRVVGTSAVTEMAVADPFDAPSTEPDPDEAERAPIQQLKSEPDNVDAEGPPEFDSERTSWEAPFHPVYWRATGWKFESAGMLSDGEESTAMFRRAYARFMFECRIEPQDETAGSLLVHLKGSQANPLMTLTIDGDRLMVTDDTRESPALIKSESVSCAAMAGQSARLKLAATGNRLIVSWNGTVVLTCKQVAGQSGRPTQFEFAAGTPWLIRDLRIEGE